MTVTRNYIKGILTQGKRDFWNQLTTRVAVLDSRNKDIVETRRVSLSVVAEEGFLEQKQKKSGGSL